MYLKLYDKITFLKIMAELFKICPTHRDGWILLGDVHREEKNWKRALLCYSNIKPQTIWDVEYATVLEKRAHCYINIERLDKAIECYELAMIYAPDKYSLYTKTSSLLFMLGIYTPAFEHLKRALALNKKNYKVHYLFYLYYKHFKEDKKAEMYYNCAKKYAPKGKKLPKE